MGQLLLSVAVIGMLSVRAYADDAGDLAELVFWQFIAHSTNPAEYQAYLDIYPAGKFAGLAKIRAGSARVKPASQPVTPVVTAPAAPPAPEARLKVQTPQVHYIDGIVADVDASALWRGSDWRLAVVAADSRDAIADAAAFALSSTPVPASRSHVTLPGGPAGQDEVRLYYLSQFGTSYEVAARAPVTIGPPVPNTALARELTHEAVAQGSVRFAAEFSGKEISIEGQFLGVKPASNFNLDWAQLFETGVRKTTLLLQLGTLGVTRDANGSTGEVACAVDASETAVLNKAVALTRGDLVVVGHPISWNSWAASDPVLLEDCRLGN